MFTRRTLFICGAGTSYEAGLPLGVGLAENIAKICDVRWESRGTVTASDGDFELYEDIKQVMPNDTYKAAWIIRDGLGFSQSIDDFLDQHRTNELVTFYGKTALIRSILKAEAESKLYIDARRAQEFDADQVRGTWFVKFMYALGRGVPKEQVGKIFDNVAFIVFNYDRCIEHFLLHALKRAYNIGDNEAQPILEKLTIIHPYGIVAPLRQIPFGAANVNCTRLTKQIRTYTEQEAVPNIADQIASEVARARCMIFLGFAYHPQNVRLLQPKSEVSRRPVFGTAYKMSDSDVGVVTRQIRDFMQPPPSISNAIPPTTRDDIVKLENKLTCTDLFDYYARSLSGD